MVLNHKKNIVVVFSVLFSLSSLFAAKIPAFRGYVNDYANVISSQKKQEMTEYLGGLEASTGIQIAVLTIPSLEGEDIASFSIRVCEAWKIGQAEKDNGALLLLAMEERDLRIEVGYGLEDKLTDAKCGLILRNVVIPELREGDYSNGLLKGVQNMGGIASDNAEVVSTSVSQNNDSEDDLAGFIFMVIWLFVFVSLMTSRNGFLKWILFNNLFGRRRGRYYSSSHRNSAVNRSGMSFGSGMSRGAGFGSGSNIGGSMGGGFHGGGGGHFGGGGASAHF